MYTVCLIVKEDPKLNIYGYPIMIFGPRFVERTSVIEGQTTLYSYDRECYSFSYFEHGSSQIQFSIENEGELLECLLTCYNIIGAFGSIDTAMVFVRIKLKELKDLAEQMHS